MGNFALNHMTVANASFADLLSIAQQCGCGGVELRNDTGSRLFDGMTPANAAELVAANNLHIYALAEVKSFNQLSAQTVADTHELAKIANACGAKGIALIPANDGAASDEANRKESLRVALLELIPILESFNLVGLVEPLGFATASLRSKREVVEVIERLGATDQIKIVHDTFHHYLAGEPEIYPQHTGMVHVSGVVNTGLSKDQMQDDHRLLVDHQDRLGNIEQLSELAGGGYTGPVSMEAFAPEVHKISNPAEHLRDSFQFISSGLAAKVA